MKTKYIVLIRISALRSMMIVSGLMSFAGIALSNIAENNAIEEPAIEDPAAEATSPVVRAVKIAKSAVASAKVAKTDLVHAVASTVVSTVAANSPATATTAATTADATTSVPLESQVDEISNGLQIKLDGDVSITPILGWKIERKASGMALIMKEVLPTQTGPIDYSKPIFARNITLMTLPEARHMDEMSVDEVKADVAKMFARQGALTDFMFTDVKRFDYKGKNDGIVLYSQLTVNNFPMMQMQVIVSGSKKSYLLTYSDLAANFATPASYESAWKAMTSISVEGLPPVRFENEVTIAVTAVSLAIAFFAPFIFLRWLSARRIRNLAAELQYDWDHGAMKSDADYELSEMRTFNATRPAKKMGKMAKNSRRNSRNFGDIDVSGISTFNSDASLSFH